MFKYWVKKERKSKLLNIKTNGFDSKAEYFRYLELQQQEKDGSIKDLKTQPLFILQEGFRYKEERKYPPLKYTADFQYFCIKRGKIIVEDVKSTFSAKQTDYRLRTRLFKCLVKDRDDIEFIETIR